MCAMRLVVALAVALLAAVPAAASTDASRPPGSPDLAAMALARADLPARAEVDREGYYRDRDYVAAYVREFALGGARVGRSRLAFVSHDLGVEATAEEAASSFRELRGLLARKTFRALLARELAKEAGAAVGSVTVSRPRTAPIADGAVSIVVGMRLAGRPLQASLTFVRVDRVLGILALVGMSRQKVYPADAIRLARLGAERMRAGLVPAFVSVPAVTGVPRPGEQLSATRGAWTGDQLVYSYKWQRCSETGAEPSCVDLAGATTATYTVSPVDLTSTLRVVVTAGNRFGTVASGSEPTAVVVGPPGSPVSTSAPAIEGSATLTADPGTWSGDPTEFAHQWRRCSPATSACVDVVDATEPTYTPSPADSGSVLRVLVIATNAAGSGGALSPPSAVVP